MRLAQKRKTEGAVRIDVEFWGVGLGCFVSNQLHKAPPPLISSKQMYPPALPVLWLTRMGKGGWGVDRRRQRSIFSLKSFSS